ncbi:MAG: GTP 3',8-cyclase MoaA [Candidatus Eisenbacteria bacterium]|nr:GTP 3',8-cyclase MoaA [Candidatus Eisenbacteria bacterium]
MIDKFGRRHDNLRISVTDRCNIRCFYCMPEDNPHYMPRADLLTYEEIGRFVRVVAGLGVRKIRLTGGEPLVRRDLPELVRFLKAIPGIEEIALTTNGLLLADAAVPLREAGLSRVTVHLDSLDRERFRQIVRRDALDQVLAGIEGARTAGFDAIKVNAVAVKGLSEPDIVSLAEFGRREGHEIRYIEFMPLDADHGWRRDQVLLADDILAILTDGIGPLEPVPGADPKAPAQEYRFLDGIGRIGLIASISRPFCGSCSRIRLTADGKLRNCLFALAEADVRALLRGGAGDGDIADLVCGNVREKWEGHEINNPKKFHQPDRPMHAIGG